jgi:hypothetical protein
MLDARTTLANGYLSKSANLGSGWSTLMVDGVNKPNKLWTDIPTGQRTKIKISSASSFTDDISVFSSYIGTAQTKGTLYKVTCYLAGQIVAQYDFENMRNIVGNQVIPNAQNLIPSFEDARWSIHPNAKVLGRDVLHLDATATHQYSLCTLDVVPNTNYLFLVNHNAKIGVFKIDLVTAISSYTTNQSLQFNSGANTKVVLSLSNVSPLGAGSFDFIRPQLYQLSGLEGTLNGNAQQLNRHAKRRLYAKR